MDEDALNNRNWGYYEPSPFRGNLGFQLIPSILDRNTKSFLPGRDPNPMFSPSATFLLRDYSVSESPISVNYSWLNQHKENKFFSVLPVNPSNYSVLPETSRAQSMQILQPPLDGRAVARAEEALGEKEGPESKKRQCGVGLKAPKAKRARKQKGNMNPRVQRVLKPSKKSIEVVINGISMDISGLPIPVCSCTGTPQQCYRWGCGGWQSACCTTNVSVYPLPISTKRRSARIAGRKMSQGAFKKVLEKLAAEGYNFSNPIDLKSHWARHGTNKFVTIR